MDEIGSNAEFGTKMKFDLPLKHRHWHRKSFEDSPANEEKAGYCRHFPAKQFLRCATL
jgi:hypothetical protein